MRLALANPPQRPVLMSGMAFLGAVTAVLLGSSCSDPKGGSSLTSAGAGGDSSSDVGGGQAGDSGGGDGAEATDPGYVPLSKSLTGNWMHRDIGNCIDMEEWLGFVLPDGFSRTLVNRDACGPHSVSKVVGYLEIEPGQVLLMKYQDATAWHQRQRTSAIVLDYQHTPDLMPDPSYKPGNRALTVLAWVKTTPNGPFLRLDRHEVAMDKPKPLHTVQVTNVQLQLSPQPAEAKPGDACSMSVTLAASWDPGDATPSQTASEAITLPCHYDLDPATQWLRVTADGFEGSTVNSSWSNYFEGKGWWKKYPGPVNQYLYDAFRPVLVQPPEQRSVLLADASFGWYPEFLNDPPVSVK